MKHKTKNKKLKTKNKKHNTLDIGLFTININI